MRACHTNNCPVGIATQKENLRARLAVDEGAKRLARFLGATTHLMQTLARACGHTDLQEFVLDDLTTWKKEIAELTGVEFSGVRDSQSRGLNG
jgi:glutamate synthase domain-containing protein 2